MNQEEAEIKLIRESEVRAMLGTPRTNFNRLRREGIIPEPIHLGSSTATYWPYWEIRDLILRLADRRYDHSIDATSIEASSQIEQCNRWRVREPVIERRKPRVRRR